MSRCDDCPNLGRSVQRSRCAADTEAKLNRRTVPIAEGQEALRVIQIREQIGRGEYRVDTEKVADAILRRLLGARLAAAGLPRPQPECS